MDRVPEVLVLYHYLHPDDVVSAVHLTELCVGLRDRGWRVTASAGNRGCRNERHVYSLREEWQGVTFRRIWRPAFRQSSIPGRVANSIWMIGAWSLLALHAGFRPDVLVIGTDPILSPLVALCWRAFCPRVQIVHWCFDLYPEAAVAEGILSEQSVLTRLFQVLQKWAYRSCDIIVDIGACMRNRISMYSSSARQETIAPWALTEPGEPAKVDNEERFKLFGGAKIALLYSGNFGRAHAIDGIAELARAIEPHGGRVAFSVRGNAVGELTAAFRDSAVVFAPFASSDRLEVRLGAADVHIVTLRADWTGAVVPSKFFGALASGRPVLFIGSDESAVAQWIRELDVGWVLTRSNLEEVVSKLRLLADSPAAKESLFTHCQAVYRRHFSRDIALRRWDQILRAGLPVRAQEPTRRKVAGTETGA